MYSPGLGLLPQFVVVITGNRSLLRLVGETTGEKFEVVALDGDLLDRDLLRRLKPKLILLDDSAVSAADRIWMLRQLKRFAPNADLLYLTNEHTRELERRVRSVGVTYYGPTDHDRVRSLVEKFCSRYDTALTASGLSLCKEK